MIILIGNEFFSKKIAKSIRKESDVLAISLDTSNSLIDKLLYLLVVPFSTCIYSISASIKLGGSLRYALFWRKKIVQHFIGSDVSEAIQDYESNIYSHSLINTSTYFSEVDWIQRELFEKISISSDVVPLPVVDKVEASSIKPAFSVLCYLGQDAEEFYGINEIISVAAQLPEIKFIIAGSDGGKYRKVATSNIKFLGWINNFNQLIKENAIYLRHTQHDGLPFSLVEALSFERWVIYNREFPHCHAAETAEQMIGAIKSIQELYNQGHCSNKGALEFITEHYAERNAVKKMLEKII